MKRIRIEYTNSKVEFANYNVDDVALDRIGNGISKLNGVKCVTMMYNGDWSNTYSINN